MPALAKDTETFPGFTLKAMLATLILDGESLASIQKTAKKNFPRKAPEAIEKMVYRLTKRINRKGLKAQILTDKLFEKPEEPITVKGLDVSKFAKAPKAKKEGKAKSKKSDPVDRIAEAKAKAKGKGKGKVVQDDDADVPEG